MCNEWWSGKKTIFLSGLFIVFCPVILFGAIVPDVRGMSKEQAESMLVLACLSPGLLFIENDDAIPSGNVIRQQPQAGVEAEDGSAVDLILSQGAADPDSRWDNKGVSICTDPPAHIWSYSTWSGMMPDPLELDVLHSINTEYIIDPIYPNYNDWEGSFTAVSPISLQYADVTEEQYVSTASVSGSLTGTMNISRIRLAMESGAYAGFSLGKDAWEFHDYSGIIHWFSDGAYWWGSVEGDIRGVLEGVDAVSAVLHIASIHGEKYAGSLDIEFDEPVMFSSSLHENSSIHVLENLEWHGTGTGLNNGDITHSGVRLVYLAEFNMGHSFGQWTTGDGLYSGNIYSFVCRHGLTETVVPRLIGLSREGAEETLLAHGLSAGTVTSSYSNDVPEGSVITQSVSAGELVEAGFAVDVVVSLGQEAVEPHAIIVPNVTGLDINEARDVIVTSGLTVGTTLPSTSATVPAGVVMQQGPGAGLLVSPGTQVVLLFSSGPRSVIVPDIIGMSRNEALSVLEGAGLSVGMLSEQHSSTVSAGLVMSQDPAPGSSVLAKAAVDLVVSAGQEMTCMPNVVGMSRESAVAAIDNAHLSVGTCAYEYNRTMPANHVVNQGPGAGMAVAIGSPVTLIISLGIETVAVPNVEGMSCRDAELALKTAHLVVGTKTYAPSTTVASGIVIRQSPIPGTQLEASSGIVLLVSSGPRMTTMPDVVGLTKTQAASAISTAMLTVGQYYAEYSSTVAKDCVIRTSSPAGAQLAAGTKVVLLVSLGPRMTTVPNVNGMSLSDASAVLGSAQLVVGATVYLYSPAIPVGHVIQVMPFPGTQLVEGTSVTLYVSIPR